MIEQISKKDILFMIEQLEEVNKNIKHTKKLIKASWTTYNFKQSCRDELISLFKAKKAFEDYIFSYSNVKD